jgi:hypothetical protein
MANLTLSQAVAQQALAEGFANGPTPTLNLQNVNTQALLGNTLTPVQEPAAYFPPTTITPNLGLTLTGLDDVAAQDMVLIDAAAVNTPLSATVTLTSAQILALFTTPVQLVAAPGPGLAIVPTFALLNYIAGSAAYSNNLLNIGYGSPSTVVAFGGGFTNQLVSPTNNATFRASSLNTGNSSGIINLPLQIQTPVSNPTGGNGTMSVTLWYYVLPLS